MHLPKYLCIESQTNGGYYNVDIHVVGTHVCGKIAPHVHVCGKII